MSAKKTVLVTGAAGGIGIELVKVLANDGWAVIGSDVKAVDLQDFKGVGGSHWISADLQDIVHDSNELKTFVNSVLSFTEELELKAVIHNAALQRVNSFLQLSAEDWLESIAINLLAPVLINRCLIPHLRKNGGSIIHIGSIHSQLTKPGFTAYATSKAALGGLTRAMAVELGGEVRINAIEPAAIETPMLTEGFKRNLELKAELASFHPTNSIGRPADVAHAVQFLLDPRNTFINGSVISLDGGISSRLHDPT